MTKGARTLHYDDNLILVTTYGVENISIDEQPFDFSYSLKPKKFLGSTAVRNKFAKLYKLKRTKKKSRFDFPNFVTMWDRMDHNIINSYLCRHHTTKKIKQPYQE